MSIADFCHPSVSAWARFFPFTEPALSTIRFFAEFTLSENRFFAALRMTRGEGFRVRMTKAKGKFCSQDFIVPENPGGRNHAIIFG